MNRLKCAQIICPVFPPLISQSVRNLIFPRKLAIQMAVDFTKKSVTGSCFKGNTLDFHEYPFSVHGFFDWRNIILAHFFLKNTKGDIIEIGANVGTETIGYSDILYHKGNLHAFEPLPMNVDSLQRLVNKKENIKIYPCAISNTKGNAKFLVPPNTLSGIGTIVSQNILKPELESIIVQTARLDDYIDEFKTVRFISIDTEGHEPYVLEGSLKTIARFRPAIVLEVSPKLLRKASDKTIEDIYSFFNQCHYICYRISRFSVNKININDLQVSVSSNWLCLPKESHLKIKAINRVLLKRTVIPWYILPSLCKYSTK